MKEEKMKTILNPDSDFVREIRRKIRKNGGYCCCALVKNPDTKCMCKDFREQTEEGFCNCGLYQKVREK
jgi:hypothetical protein